MTTHKLPNRCCLTFLTDFGVRDSFVGQMKGVAISINSDLHLVDLTHEIPPQQVLRGAFVWNDAVQAFPSGTIHVGIVDPGVGSTRRLIAAEIGTQRFVCPDNGLLTVILQRASAQRVVNLDNRHWWRSNTSNTFHGRDILTPVAAAWSLGHDLEELGTITTDAVLTLPMATVVRGNSSLTGQVVDVDRFGNLITNIGAAEISSITTTLSVEIGSFRIEGISKCYSDVAAGEAVALIGSTGRLEISIRDGSAADELQADCGRRVTLRWSGRSE